MNALKKLVLCSSRNTRLLAFAFLGFSASAQADTTNEAKSQALFMGSNILIRYKNALYPVVDLNGSYWVIEVNGERREIPTKTDHLEIKVVPAMKLTHTSAAISHLVAERDYTPPNDPSTRLTRDIAESEKLNFGYQVLNNQVAALIDTPITHNSLSNIATPFMFAEADLHELQQGSALAGIRTGSEIVIASPTRSQMRNTSDKPMPRLQPDPMKRCTDDAACPWALMRCGSASISTPTMSSRGRMSSPIRCSERRDEARHGPKPHLRHGPPSDRPPAADHRSPGGRIPPNFEKVSFQLHLYEGQKEIATNVSSKRVDLTSDEAFEYLKLEYLAAHKGETLAAAPLMGTLPASFPETVRSGRYSGDYYVRISKDGIPEGVFRDASGKESLNDSTLETIVQNIRFQPALKKGVPVEAIAPLNLHRLEF